MKKVLKTVGIIIIIIIIFLITIFFYGANEGKKIKNKMLNNAMSKIIEDVKNNTVAENSIIEYEGYVINIPEGYYYAEDDNGLPKIINEEQTKIISIQLDKKNTWDMYLEKYERLDEALSKNNYTSVSEGKIYTFKDTEFITTEIEMSNKYILTVYKGTNKGEVFIFDVINTDSNEYDYNSISAIYEILSSNF